MNNKYLKILLSIAVVAALALSAAPIVAMAQNNSSTGANPGNSSTGANPGNSSTGVNPGNSSTGYNPGTMYLQNPLKSNFNTVGGLIEGFLSIVTYLAVILAVLLLIWVGLQFVLAQGNTKRLGELKNWLLWIVVGVAIIIAARVIVAVVINTLEATGTVNDGIIDSARDALSGS